MLLAERSCGNRARGSSRDMRRFCQIGSCVSEERDPKQFRCLLSMSAADSMRKFILTDAPHGGLCEKFYE